MALHRYGWTCDLPDFRDLLYTPEPGITLPASVDLRPFCSKVEDQGNLGSCTANALVGALEILEIKKWKKYLDLSRLFVYYNERVIEDSVDQDSGAMIRDGIKSLATLGVCLESIWPYDIEEFTRMPTPAAYKEAELHKIISYHRLNGLNDMLSVLAGGLPFVFGFSVYQSFESEEVSKTGIVPMPKRNEQQLGGHAVVAVGYTLADQRFLVRNSWGNSWGMGGYFTIPFGYLTHRGLASDFWMIRTANV